MDLLDREKHKKIFFCLKRKNIVSANSREIGFVKKIKRFNNKGVLTETTGKIVLFYVMK